MTAIITLTTDFGTADTYVAQMKGVILGINPQVVVVDVTHSIPPGDVRLAGLALDQMVDAFPHGTIHIGVVDPGVGSGRALLAVEVEDKRFLVPDNGLLTEVLRRHVPRRVHRLSEKRFWRTAISSTFHGRDILAPVAAHWTLGLDIAQFGPALDTQELVRLDQSAPVQAGTRWRGEVIAVDRFGNLITRITEAMIPRDARGHVVVTVGETAIRGVSEYYSEQAPGALLALIGSSGRLEIAVNGGSAAARLGVGTGSIVSVDVGLSDDE